MIELAHDKKYIEKVNNSFPNNGLAFLDSDTIVSQGSKQASYDAVNSVLTAIDNVQDGSYQNAFVSIRPHQDITHTAILLLVFVSLITLLLEHVI